MHIVNKITITSLKPGRLGPWRTEVHRSFYQSCFRTLWSADIIQCTIPNLENGSLPLIGDVASNLTLSTSYYYQSSTSIGISGQLMRIAWQINMPIGEIEQCWALDTQYLDISRYLPAKTSDIYLTIIAQISPVPQQWLRAIYWVIFLGIFFH